MKLTQNRIEDLECPKGAKDKLVFDDEQGGLGVRVTKNAKSGSMAGKTYLAQYTVAGQKRRVALGACDSIKLVDARKAAAAIMGDVAQGRDPALERRQAAQEAKRKSEVQDLGTLIDQWQALHLKDKRPYYATAAVQTLRRVFARHLARPAGGLDRPAVVRTLDDLAEAGKAQMSAMAARYGSALYGWALKRSSVNDNPFARVPYAPIVRRKRVLAEEEIRHIWNATAGPGPFNAIVRALLLTGARREEIAGMAWCEISVELTYWTLPEERSKNGLPHLVPLSAPMQTLLRSRPRPEGTDLVFPGERGAFSGWSKAKRRLDKESDASDWTLHDLRRTAATGMADLGVQPHVVEAVFNHISGYRAGVAGVYNRASYANEKRHALDLWGEHIVAIVEGREQAVNVLEFQRRGRKPRSVRRGEEA